MQIDIPEHDTEGIVSHLWPKVRSAAIIALVVSIPATVAYGLLFLIAFRTGVDPTVLVRDPATISGVPFYFGLISNIGVLIWAVSASISLFAGWLVYKWSDDNEMASFLVLSGAATTLLLLDDFFLFHDQIGILYLGIREIFVFAAMAFMLVVIFYRFRKTIFHTNCLLLGVSVGMITVSIFLDRPIVISASPLSAGAMTAFEEFFKLLGIVIWATYFVHVGLSTLSQIIEGRRSNASS